MDKLIPLGDPNAVVCEDDTCEIPGATPAPTTTG
jgi:hypothetical protein